MSPESKTDWQPSASFEVLQFRARLLQGIRAFFTEQDVLEVETPVLSRATITDPHLQSFSTQYLSDRLYLQTSPEFFMKRLLASGSGDIFQLCRVFRDDELGRYHNPEFSMLEWYRLGMDHHLLMDDMEALLNYLSGKLGVPISGQIPRRLSYQQAFVEALGIDPLAASAGELKAVAQQRGIEIPVGMDELDRDMWLDWLMTQGVAPSFVKQGFTFVFDYPASQAALARVSEDDPRVAHRFELFWGELELANGFYELTDAEEQRSRFEQENQQRIERGMEPVTIDEYMLTALGAGLPDCSGVAIGVDRLLMVLLSKILISEVLAFSFQRS